MAMTREQLIAAVMRTAQDGDAEAAEASIKAAYHQAGLAEPVVLHPRNPVEGITQMALLSGIIGRQGATSRTAKLLGRARGDIEHGIVLWHRTMLTVVDEARRAMTPEAAVTARAALAEKLGRPLLRGISCGGIDARMRSYLSSESSRISPVLAIMGGTQAEKDPPPSAVHLADAARHCLALFTLRDAVIVIPFPREFHTLAAPQDRRWRWGGSVPHRQGGPAMVWDGYSAWFLQGVEVTQAMAEEEVTIERLLATTNSEQRRVMIDLKGWEWLEEYLTEVDRAPDPGNAPHEVILYDLPPRMRMRSRWNPAGNRIVLMHNASPNRNGTDRRYGELVPGTISSVIEAQARAFGVTAEEYMAIERAT